MLHHDSVRDAFHAWLAAETEAERALKEFCDATEMHPGRALEKLLERSQQARRRANSLNDALLAALDAIDATAAT
jgi:ferric-dicitrate binding protein FerR (iron transport regulator)